MKTAFELVTECKAEQALLQFKGNLMFAIRTLIEQNYLSQSKAAAIVGCSQPRMSNLLKGKISLFSADYLYIVKHKLQEYSNEH